MIAVLSSKRYAELQRKADELDAQDQFVRSWSSTMSGDQAQALLLKLSIDLGAASQLCDDYSKVSSLVERALATVRALREGLTPK